MINSPVTPEALRDEYITDFDSCIIDVNRKPEIDWIIKQMEKGKVSYQSVGSALRIPWFFIGIIHMMECGGKFNSHLHNGDPLTARTVQWPPKRPLTGNPPFSWEESAKDALTLKKLHNQSDWSLPILLYRLEAYNGFGYRRTDINIRTPYLWSYTNHYTKGKYIRDKVFDAEAVSKQCGTAAMLKGLVENKNISQDDLDGFHIPKVPVEVLKLTTGEKGTVSVDSLNIREGPATAYKTVIAPLTKDTEVVITDEKEEWFKVETKIEGWVRKDFIKRK